MTSPRPRAVVIGSLALFAVLFVVLTFELSAAASTPAGKGRAAAKARPAEAKTDPPAEAGEEAPAEYAEPEEPAVEYVEPETEYVEPEPEYEYAEPEYAEPEVEEIPPVVTSSS
jgi:hypothetical protein